MVISALPFIAGSVSILLGAVVLAGGATKAYVKIPFCLFSFSVGIWAIFISLFLFSDNAQVAQIYASIYYISALLIGYMLMFFGFAYSGVKISGKMLLVALAPWLFMSIIILFTDLLVKSIYIGDSNSVELGFGMYFIYGVIFFMYVIAGLGALLKKRNSLRKSRSANNLLALSLAVSVAWGAMFNLILPGLGNYSLIAWGPVFCFFMVSSVFYFITRHGLFDIKLAVVRTVAYALSLSALTAIYLVVAYVVFGELLGQASTSEQAILNMALTVLLVFIFQPIRRFFDKLTNNLFYKDMYDAESFYAQVNSLVVSAVDLTSILESASELIKDTLKSESVSFFIKSDEKKITHAGTGKYRRFPAVDLEKFDTIDQPQSIDSDNLTSSQRRILVSHNVSVIAPLMYKGRTIGFLCLGDHMTSRYSRRDMKALQTVSGELVIGILNALSVQEVRSLNDNLQHRIDIATKELRRSNSQLQRLDEAKDEFISMASHQLRTPLTSIKGYLSMLIDEDLGKINNQQKHVLNEAYVSSEKMVRLIADFLNVSRLQTGKFVIDKHPVDLASLVEKEILALSQSATARGLKFDYKKPKNIPDLRLDENKIQQVIMNFSDNAVYYSKENSTIKVTLKKVGKYIEFTVRDNGIGVPEEEQAGLFGKFFRASNAKKQRPDGTGVGLFLAKKVIKDHGGEVIFNSKEGKGSTFGFRIPLSTS